MVAIGIGHIARGAQPQRQTVFIGDLAFVTFGNGEDFFRERRGFRTQAKRRVVAHLVVGNADKDRPTNQQEESQRARNRRHASAQVDRSDSFLWGYCLHRLAGKW